MSTITINNQTYDLNTLSDDSKAQIQMLQFVDAELQRLAAQTAVLQTARVGYAKALEQSLSLIAKDDAVV
jgi:hypothetical protein